MGNILIYMTHNNKIIENENENVNKNKNNVTDVKYIIDKVIVSRQITNPILENN